MIEVDEKTRERKRWVALISSGIVVAVIFPIIGIYVSILVDSWFSFPKLISEPYNFILAAAFFAVGLFWAVWANIGLFRRGEGTPIPREEIETRKLVVNGAYKYCRNPMIFGYILIWIGLGLTFNSVFLTFGITSIVTILLVAFVKLWEEKNLEKRFGKSYTEYKNSVSFLIPMPPKKQK
ncbi:MAG: methyltransferase family protein [Candidatus Jordarchaeum sp.]|uniref:methyltransferase family protein n=1 Tax=Candidatus Jordarchaeum sp. TaxID=2823881 RepID=UPI00404ADDF6